MNTNVSNSASSTRPATNRSLFIFLVFLSLGGVAIMDYSIKYGLWYWLGMSIISGAASISLAWRGAAAAGESAGGHLARQTFHWSALIVALLMVFFLQKTEALGPTTSGMMALLLLAMTTTLAGVHFRPRLALVGGIQALTFIVAALTEHFFWILLILILVILVVDIIMQQRRNSSAT